MERVLKYKPELSKETLDSIKKYYILLVLMEMIFLMKNFMLL